MEPSARQLDRVAVKLRMDIREGQHHVRGFVVHDGQRLWPPLHFPKSRKNIPPRVLSTLLKSLRLRSQEFVQLYSCTLSRDQYFELRERRTPPAQDRVVELPCLLDAYGQPISSTGDLKRPVIEGIRDVSESLLSALKAEPKLVYSLAPREFEVLIASLLNRKGYDVRLTPMVKDGGKDVIIATTGELGSHLYLVECKRFAPERTVGVDLVRAFYGTVSADGATAGILVTTSRFSHDAKEFERTVKYRLSLKDFYDLVGWIDEVVS